jgi:hypothetical protein
MGAEEEVSRSRITRREKSTRRGGKSGPEAVWKGSGPGLYLAFGGAASAAAGLAGGVDFLDEKKSLTSKKVT